MENDDVDLDAAILAEARAFPTPSSEEVEDYIQTLGCFIHGHHRCLEECRDSTAHLMEADLIVYDGDTDTYSWTARMLFAVSHLEHHNQILNWPKIATAITQQAAAQLRKRADLFGTIDAGTNNDDPTGEDDEDTDNDDVSVPGFPSPTPPPQGPPSPFEIPPAWGPGAPPGGGPGTPSSGGPGTPPGGVPGAGPGPGHQQYTYNNTNAQQTSILKLMSEAIHAMAVSRTPLALQNQAGITIDNQIGATKTFSGDMRKGKECFRTWLTEFKDRANRLHWDDEVTVRNFIACQVGPARVNVEAFKSTASEEMQAIFTDDWPGLERWAMETYAIGGATYFLNWRHSSAQQPAESLNDFYNRHRLDLARFYEAHHTYIKGQLLAKINFMVPGQQPSGNPAERPFTADMSRRMANRLTQLDKAYSAAERQQLMQSFCIEDQGRGVRLANEVLWNNFFKVVMWIDINHTFIDGMSSSSARLQSYKERDKVFLKTDLSGRTYGTATQALKVAIQKIEDRVRGNNSIYAIGSVKTDAGTEVAAAHVKGRKIRKDRNRKHKARINEVAETEDPEPAPAGVAAIERAPQGLRKGESFTGKDGLRRTPGARCATCHGFGHRTEDCGKSDAGAHRGPTVGAVDAGPNVADAALIASLRGTTFSHF